MLKKRKKVKIIMTIIALILALGLFINCQKIDINKETYAPTMNLATAEEIRLAATTIGLEHGTINPIYRPKWEKISSSIDTTKKTLTVKVKGYAYENQTLNANAKIDYASDVESTLSSENITVFFDGVKVTSKTNPKITVANKTVTHNAVSNKDEVTYDIILANLEETARQAGKQYKEWSGNIALKIGGRGESETTYNANVLTDQYKNQNMMELDGKDSSWIDVKIEDAKTDKNASGTMFADYIKPEFTYVYSNGNINLTNKTLTVDFSVVDKYFSSTTLSARNAADAIKVSLTDTNPASQIPDAKITKELTKVSDVTEKRDGVDVKIGEKYRLVIKGLQQQTADGKYRDYSGPMSISIPAGVATDKSGNKSIATTFSIGVNEPGGSSDNQKIVDVVDPLWKTENINIDHTNKVVTLDLVGTDKYYASNSLTTNSIKVIIDGEEVTTTANVKKSLSAATPLTETRNGTSIQYGVRYTLTLSDWEEATKQTGKQFFEWSGTTKIQVAAGTITDQYTNKSKKQEFTLGHVDFIKPKIEKVSFAKDSTAKTETIIFNVIDKYLDVRDKVTTDEISVYVDGELVPSSQITRTLTKISDLTGTVNKTTKVIGHQYKLVLSNFEQKRTAINYNREYSDWSGNVKIKIAEGAVKDTNSPTPNKNEATEIKADDSDAKKDFVDFVKPNATYKYSESDINYDGKTFTMVFDVTDKFYSSGTLTIDDLDIKIDGETPNWDSTGIHGVVKELSVTDRSNSISITENGVVKAVTKVIGKRYTLKLSHLEQLEKLQGKDTMDYSGVITVAVAKDKFADTSGNKNNAFTITSGINIAGEKLGTDGKVVDVVDPIWEKVSSSASAAEQTATITVKGTDKYFKASSLNANLIKVFVDGKEVTTGITKTVGTSSPAYGSDKATRIGDQYTITISGSGLTKNAKQIKIQIQPNAITDTSNNTNKATDLLLYNTLVNTSSEPAANSGFLGSKNSENTNVSKIERQNIENVTFMDNIPSSVYDKSAKAYVDTTAWDVSAQQDKSILAWYTTNAKGTLKVYIGSDDEIFGNYDSSLLFAYIGYSEEDKFTATETISNIGLLNVSSVTNMTYMFRQTGHNAMTKLDLGDNFDTSNVTNMTAMFRYTGSKKMLTFNLGSKFNTSKVTDMHEMFICTGYHTMEQLDLGDKFDTSNVTDMSSMFYGTGCYQMTSLNLGDKFDTSNVTNMNEMFIYCGGNAMTQLNLGTKFDTSKVTTMASMFGATGSMAMTSLDLGDKFDTSNVENMTWMFSDCGREAMTTLNLGNKFNTSKVKSMLGMFNRTGNRQMTKLDLGDLFYTTNVEDMAIMFRETGGYQMTELDLGPAFTNIPNATITGGIPEENIENTHSANYKIFDLTGKSGCVIHAPESIFQDKNNFKLNTDATTSAINYTRGTINPKYRTEWIKQASQITIDNNDLANSKINITLRGRTNAEAGKDFTSDVESSLSNEKINDQIKVYIDGEEATSITKQVAAATEATNETTEAKDVVQVLTLSNFEEALRQKGKNYKEWSGNISLKIAKKTLKDTTYQNQNLQAIDTSGTMEDIILKGTGTESTNNKTSTTTMFTDYIRPEFTYEAANTIIDQGKKNVTVIFDITDKYFQSSKIDLTTMTIKVDGKEPDWTKVTRTFKKKQIAADVTEGNIIYRANGDIYTTVNGKQVKIGERYEFIVNGLETKNGEGYSGPMTITFPAGELNTDGTIKKGIVDKSGNLSLAKTITIGIDDPENHEDHKDPDIVDVVNPVWTYGTSSINRIRDGKTADTVELTIIGSDKYYKSNSLTKDKIKVYVDDKLESSITKDLVSITDTATLKQLATKQGLADVDNVKLIGYKLTLGNFGKINGVTKIVIDAGTIVDNSGNVNLETTILVGNKEWVEKGDSSTNQKYPAFRDSIVDFIKPLISYKYSKVTGSANPEIDYKAKTLTVKFDVTDKHIREDSIMNKDGTLNANNIRIKVAGTDLTDKLHTTVTSKDLQDGTGKEYTFVISNFELIYNESEKYKDYSGAVTFVFAADKVDDTSGNKNGATTLTLDYDDGDDERNPVIVDVIDPLIEKTADNLSKLNLSNGINRDITNETGTVSVRIKATDKYLSKGTLQDAANVAKIRVKVVKPSGETVYPDTITKQVSQISQQQTEITYQITLGNFGENEGLTSIIIPEGVIIDKSGNTNRETELLVGNATWTESGDTKGEYTAFRNSIVDFTRPVWEYSTSSITRDRDGETGTVTVKILGRDIYYLKDTLTENNIDVFVANSKNPNVPITTITKKLTKITNTAELDGADTGYNLTLGNFGTYDGAVKIRIAENSIRDTSGNGNKQTEISVGNKNWVEKDIGDNENSPKYTAFRNSIVDFIKPTIKYKYKEGVNPLIDSTNKQVRITFDAVDTNFLESNILTADDIKQILVDDMDVTDYITKNLTKADITDGSGNGVRYTLTLSNFELDKNLENEIFRRHSGKIEFVIAAGKVKDTSGNENIETKIIVDNDNGDDANNFIKVDFIKPKLFYVDKDISYAQRYATVTIAGTDRFYDFNTKLTAEDITIYELNRNGEYVQRTDLPISITPVKTKYGYNFVIKISEFEEEFKKFKISIPAGKIADTGGLTNEATDIIVDLDNKKPVWKYMSTDTSKFENDGTISFNVKGQDTFLVLDQSNLTDANVKIFKDGKDVAGATAKVTSLGEDANEISKSYKIDITGLKEIGNYSLVIEKETLVDEFDNKSNTTTISFSKSAISSNTDNYTMITYHTSPDFKETHQSYVHELMSVNESGTNAESTTYRASSIGEIYDDGKNAQFAEPFGYSFKGWAVANNKGFSADDAKIYSLYDDIPNTVTHLNAIWQKATVIFVSKSGNNSNDGLSPEKPVKDLQTAYGKLNSSGKSSENIIVIMDAVEWNSSDKLTGNATITSLYAGVDYRTKGAELKVSSNMNIEGDVAFDNIKLYSSSTKVSDGSDYLSKGDYSNVLITNYGDVTLGRGISTPDGKYTFGAVVGGNYKTEAKLGTIGIHTVIVEAGKYNNIITGSSLETQTTKSKYVSHQVMIGTMKESAVSRNEKLTITGYLAMGESEDGCYPYNTNGSQSTTTAYSMKYSITKIYSAKFTGENKFNKSSENASIYLRTIDGFNDGINGFYMYGGEVTGNVYGGSRAKVKKDPTGSEPIANELNFYGGQITGDIFGNGNKNFSIGSSTITLSGRIAITGNVFGGSNTDTEAQGQVSGNTNIIVNSGITVNGNIYGGSKGVINGTSINVNTGAINGNTNITLNTGTIKGDIYGGGQNGGVSDSANININNGQVTGNIYGGAYQNQVRTQSNINILGGTVQNVYGGNILTTSGQQNNDTVSQNVNIVIGSKDVNTTPTIKGTVYGSGKYERVGTVEIQLVKSAKLATIYGGSDEAGITNEVNIYLKGITANTIYGGSKTDGIVTTANIFLQSGTVTDVYGGGYGGTTTTANVTLEGTANVTSLFGGSNTNGTVETSNVELKSGKLLNVYGGGNSVAVETANVTLDGITIDEIHGGSKNAGITTNTNVVLNTGKVTDVFGGGYDVGVTNAKVTQNGATVTNIYGGNQGGTGNGGDTDNATVNIAGKTANNIYGGNKEKGTTKNATINITGASTITGKLYGGGYKSAIGKSGNTGSTTINITGGTIENDINGGSEDSTVYGTTNINVGKDTVTDDTLVAGNINIKGNIYGAGSTANDNFDTVSVYGATHVTMDGSTASPITFANNIFGAGKGSTYETTDKKGADKSTVKIKDLGTSANAHKMISIQRTGKVSVQNSYLELTGAQDANNYYKRASYTLNRVTNGLTLLDNSTLYTQRAFNMVGGFESLVTNEYGTTIKETVSIENGTVTRNVDNRLYTLEGVNLIFAKQEGNLEDRSNEDIWGDVKGMAFFGMYRTSRTTGAKEYDIYAPDYNGTVSTKMFANGTYVEGRHKPKHNITVDGFYSNIADDTGIAKPQVIDVTDYGTYYDWIIGADVVNYATSLIASTYSTYSMADLQLDLSKVINSPTYSGTSLTLNRVSSNALNTDINLIDRYTVPTYSENANNTFGMTMETTHSGWTKGGITELYTDSDGSFGGTNIYRMDNSGNPGTITFKLFNSVNVSETKDLGFVNIVFTGKSRSADDPSVGNTFKVVIAVNIQSLYEEESKNYVPRFTNSIDTELNYTTDSSVDISYVLYEVGLGAQSDIYATDDYRVLSTSTPLPKGTKVTLRDYGQGDNVNKVYYYQVASDTDYDATDNSSGSTRYLYKLSKFIDMGGTTSKTAKYANNNSQYYHSGSNGGYALEKYEVSFNFIDSNINANKIAQETYLELRSSSGSKKYGNGQKNLKYNMYTDKANLTETVVTDNGTTSYTVFENLSIPFKFDASLLEQKVADGKTIMDTKYYDKKLGMAIEIVDEHGERIKAPELQNFKLIDKTDSTVYPAGADGVIRVPLSDNLAELSNSYELAMTQSSVSAGQYIAKIYFFASDNGIHYGGEEVASQEIYITFINKLLGLAGIETADGSRIVNKETGLNLDGGNGLDLTVKVGSPTNDTNIRVELYKRNDTYTTAEDGTKTYNGISYTKVDLKDYLKSLDGTELKTPEQCIGQNLVTASGGKEYMVMEKKEHPTFTDNEYVENVEFKKLIKEGISTGEYKLVFKAYYNNTLIQEIRKSFIVE